MSRQYMASYLRSIALYNMRYKEQFVEVYNKLKQKAEDADFELTLDYKLEEPVVKALRFYEFSVTELAGDEEKEFTTIIKFI